jgi:molecular chaperone GrpE
MNNQENIPKPDNSIDVLDTETTASVDDFIRELEEKEKDLHITADLKIEVEDPDIETEIPEFVQGDLASTGQSSSSAQPVREAGSKTQVFELNQEVERLNDRLRVMRMERDDIQEKSDRRLKDFENYKYRMDRERRGSFIEQISTLASQMLPVLDNLDRALESVEKVAANRSEDFQQFYHGIMLVNQQVNEVFAGMGVEPITSVGERFDPNFHEAVAAEHRDDLAPNTILEEMLRGYKIGNRVIRHSMVKVSAAPPAPRLSEAGEGQPAAIPAPEAPLPDPAEETLPEA